jgi:hypothetical protein
VERSVEQLLSMLRAIATVVVIVAAIVAIHPLWFTLARLEPGPKDLGFAVFGRDPGYDAPIALAILVAILVAAAETRSLCGRALARHQRAGASKGRSERVAEPTVPAG